MVVMVLKYDGGHEEGNDENFSSNDSILAVSTGGDGACSNGAMPASCNGRYDAERALIKVIEETFLCPILHRRASRLLALSTMQLRARQPWLEAHLQQHWRAARLQPSEKCCIGELGSNVQMIRKADYLGFNHGDFYVRVGVRMLTGDQKYWYFRALV